MILTKDLAGLVPYLIPGGDLPSSVSWTLYDRTATALASDQAITIPTLFTVSSASELSGNDEIAITLAAAPTGIAVGDTVRLRDSYARDFDCAVWGVDATAKTIRVADFGGIASEVETCWNPKVTVPIAAIHLDESGDGWRVTLDIDGTEDTIWFSVALMSMDLSISPRDYLDRHPEASNNLAHLESRRDWKRLIGVAGEKVEERIRTRTKWYSLIISSTGIRRAVVEALNVLLSSETCPAGVNLLDWLDRSEARFNSAVSDLLSSGYYDDDESGTADTDEESPPAQTSYKVL